MYKMHDASNYCKSIYKNKIKILIVIYYYHSLVVNSYH